MNGGIIVWTIVGESDTIDTSSAQASNGRRNVCDLPVRMIDNRAASEGRPESGLLPTSLFLINLL